MDDTRKTSVFVRESTGLVKNVTLLDALSMNLGSMEVGLALASLGFTMVLLPSFSGVNMIYASIIGLLITIPQIVVYQMFITRIARTGGDYVWSSRNLGGALGGILAFGGVMMVQLAYDALTIIATIFAIGAVGVELGASNFTALALPSYAGGNPALQLVIGAVLFVAIIAVNIFRPKAGFRIVTYSIIAGIILLALASIVLLAAGQVGVAHYINSLDAVGPNNQQITYSSLAASGSSSGVNWGNTLMFMPFFIFFSYPWFATAAPTTGSEFKGRGTTKYNIPLAVIITFIFMTVPLAVMYYVGGFGFINAALGNPTLVYNYSFNFWTLAMGASGSPILALVIGLGWVLWDVALLGYLVVATPRYLMAMGFDRFLPTRFADVNRYGSPWVSYIFVLIVSLVVTGLAVFLYGIFSSLYGIGMNNWLWFITVGVAAIVFAWRKLTGKARTIMAVCGTLMSIVYIYISYIFLDYPGIWGGNYLAYGFDAFAFILGIALYIGSYYYNKARNININLAFKEIPPE